LSTRKVLVWVSAGALVLIAVGMSLIPWVARRNASILGTDGYRSISFVQLAGFPYSPPPRQSPNVQPPVRSDVFPAEVQALSGTKISIAGYIVPLTVKDGLIERFYLSRSVFGCCYADMPRMTDYIKVTLAPDIKVPLTPAQCGASSRLSRVRGMLEVGEELSPEGDVESVYRLHADSVQDKLADGPAWVEPAVWGIGGLILMALFGPIGVQFVKQRRGWNGFWDFYPRRPRMKAARSRGK
jgi:hypothetical protein